MTKETWNWFEFLDRAIKEPDTYPTDELQTLAESLADSWTYCACGQLCKDLPRDIAGVPHDGRLVFLGALFAGQIDNFEYKMALETFHQIEQRTLELLTKPV
jgi:hypothetical protein